MTSWQPPEFIIGRFFNSQEKLPGGEHESTKFVCAILYLHKEGDVPMNNYDYRKAVILVALLGAVFVLAACSDSDSLAGTYVCTEHWSSESLVGKLTLVMGDDETFTMTPPGGGGMYEVNENVVTLSGDLFPSGLDLQVEGSSLRIPSDMGDTVYTKQ